MYRMKRLGLAVAASMLAALVGAGSASAANWDPPNTTLTAHGTLTLDLAPSGVSVNCTYHSGIRSAGGADALTTLTGGTIPAPPTFYHCVQSLPGTVSVVIDAPWTLTATSTTALDLTNGNITMTLNIFGDCAISASGVSLPWLWTNATSTITLSATSFPVTETGAFCPDDSTMTITGSIVVSGASIT
jgi:hypothetical protein